MKNKKKLNFGSGKDIKKGYINVDITKFPGTDKAFNFDHFPYPFKDNEFDEIYSDNVIEHLEDVTKVMKELHRITKKDGVIRIIVPYYNCYGAYNDLTHKHYFSPFAFDHFYKKNPRGNYFIKERFELKSIDFIPTTWGKFIPARFRLAVSFILGQIIMAIDISLIVKK